MQYAKSNPKINQQNIQSKVLDLHINNLVNIRDVFYTSDTYSSPNLSSGKNSLKPPDLWTHGSGLNEFAEMPSCNQIDQISNDSYSVDRWTLKSSNIPGYLSCTASIFSGI